MAPVAAHPYMSIHPKAWAHCHLSSRIGAEHNLLLRITMKTGIIGLPQVGKTSLFKILTRVNVEDRGYSREAHLGMATVPDDRLDRLAAQYNPKKLTHATVEYSDVAAIGQE